MLQTLAILSALAALSLLDGLGNAAQAAPLRTVALTGQQPPGTHASVEFSGFFRSPSINSRGQVAFWAGASVPGILASASGVWSEGSGELRLVELIGTEPVINEAGDVAYTYGHSFKVGDHLSSRAVMRVGDQAPGTPDGVAFTTNNLIALRRPPQLNDAGHILFSTRITGPGVSEQNDYGMWAGDAESLRLVIRTGDPHPGLADSLPIRYLFSGDLNNRDQIALATDRAIYRWQSESFSLISVVGGEAPGVEGPARFASLRSPYLNDSGDLVFAATLDDAEMTIGLWMYHDSEPSLVALAGERAEGTPEGVTFASFNRYEISGDGVVAILGFVTGEGIDASNDQGIWSGRPGSLELVAREGDNPPGVEPGVAFASGPLALRTNDRGQIVFASSLSGPGITDSNDYGIWAHDSSGSLKLIAREGDLLEVGPYDFRRISRLSNSYGFNDSGQIAFNAIFDDASEGVFVSNLVAIPEPAACLIAAGTLLCWWPLGGRGRGLVGA